jgi:ABC-type phosphate/phosphonate transport system substrate-binding protein
MVVRGGADVAALDCVSYAHFQRLYPALAAGLRVIAWTPASACLPFVTARSTNDEVLAALRAALTAVVEDPSIAPLCARLLLTGIDVAPDPGFTRVLSLERDAAALGYPVLL